MDAGLILLRFVHIMCGVFWAGTLLFFATLVEPSIRESGPDGARVMQALLRRHYLTIMPVVAGLTILSGVDLLRRVSGGFAPAWFTSPTGLTLTVGSLAAFVAFLIGVFVMRPAALRVGRLAQAAAQSPEGPGREAQLAEVQAIRRRALWGGRWVACLLTLAVAGMAVARYVR